MRQPRMHEVLRLCMQNNSKASGVIVWLREEDSRSLVREIWHSCKIGEDISMNIQFADSLIKLKWDIIEWVKIKMQRDEEDLKKVSG